MSIPSKDTVKIHPFVVLMGFAVFLLIPVAFLILAFVVGCGKTYPSVNHTLTFSNIPQTAWSCAQTTGRGQGERCLKAHPEARKTFGPNGFEKDKGDCLYDYPEVGFQKAGFYLDNQNPTTD